MASQPRTPNSLPWESWISKRIKLIGQLHGLKRVKIKHTILDKLFMLNILVCLSTLWAWEFSRSTHTRLIFQHSICQEWDFHTFKSIWCL
jgi:hypothetical protein